MLQLGPDKAEGQEISPSSNHNGGTAGSQRTNAQKTTPSSKAENVCSSSSEEAIDLGPSYFPPSPSTSSGGKGVQRISSLSRAEFLEGGLGSTLDRPTVDLASTINHVARHQGQFGGKGQAFDTLWPNFNPGSEKHCDGANEKESAATGVQHGNLGRYRSSESRKIAVGGMAVDGYDESDNDSGMLEEEEDMNEHLADSSSAAAPEDQIANSALTTNTTTSHSGSPCLSPASASVPSCEISEFFAILGKALNRNPSELTQYVEKLVKEHWLETLADLRKLSNLELRRLGMPHQLVQLIALYLPHGEAILMNASIPPHGFKSVPSVSAVVADIQKRALLTSATSDSDVPMKQTYGVVAPVPGAGRGVTIDVHGDPIRIPADKRCTTTTSNTQGSTALPQGYSSLRSPISQSSNSSPSSVSMGSRKTLKHSSPFALNSPASYPLDVDATNANLKETSTQYPWSSQQQNIKRPFSPPVPPTSPSQTSNPRVGSYSMSGGGKASAQCSPSQSPCLTTLESRSRDASSVAGPLLSEGDNFGFSDAVVDTISPGLDGDRGCQDRKGAEIASFVYRTGGHGRVWDAAIECLVEDNWFETLDQLRDLDDDQWSALPLPREVSGVLREALLAGGQSTSALQYKELVVVVNEAGLRMGRSHEQMQAVVTKLKAGGIRSLGALQLLPDAKWIQLKLPMRLLEEIRRLPSYAAACTDIAPQGTDSQITSAHSSFASVFKESSPGNALGASGRTASGTGSVWSPTSKGPSLENLGGKTQSDARVVSTKEERIARQMTVERFILKMGRSVGKLEDECRPVIDRLIAEHWFDNIQALRSIDLQEWKDLGVPRRLVEEIKRGLSDPFALELNTVQFTIPEPEIFPCDVFTAIWKMEGEIPQDKLPGTLRSMLKLMETILCHPFDETKRVIRKTNVNFQERAGKHKSAMLVLQAVGYEDIGDTLILPVAYIARLTEAHAALAQLAQIQRERLQKSRRSTKGALFSALS